MHHIRYESVSLYVNADILVDWEYSHLEEINEGDRGEGSGSHLLHEDMIIVCFHILQFPIHQALVDASHIVCRSSKV